MARASRELPKELVEFGQRQFKETGAQSVEVLRVKAAVIRKYWAKLKGIAFLVAVVSLDRVRVYFFTSTGVMLVGENVDHAVYIKIRGKSKLVKKYEKPKPPTELELRMEATEELRLHLSKSVRRVARFLGEKEPSFPTIFVSKQELESKDQSFSMRIEEDGAFIFQEESINSPIFEGVSIRSAFLSLLDSDCSREPIAHCIGNALASLLLKARSKEIWREHWLEYNKTSELQQVAYHLQKHLDSYGADGFSKILDIVRVAPKAIPPTQWIAALSIIHTNHEVALGTDAWHTIDGFCKSLTKPRKLATRRHVLENIHLSPRILCNTEALGYSLGFECTESNLRQFTGWLSVEYRGGNQNQYLIVNEKLEDRIKSIHYLLNLEEVIPKSGGLQSKGRSILKWAARTLGLEEFKNDGFETSIIFEPKAISESERAVLERLSLGNLEILANTLIGSPQRIDSLVNSGCISLVPDFSHIGLEPNFLLEGDFDTINKLARESALESTIIKSDSTSYGLVSAPTIWGKHLLDTVGGSLKVYPIVNVSSPRGLVRDEVPFSETPFKTWSD
ncbi:MAG: hypothetical protein KAR33_08005 [Candidatus Thorarchaeota archaeon]|nr:hypothetical protein [Candidatus Thorarchaeota archaeon]